MVISTIADVIRISRSFHKKIYHRAWQFFRDPHHSGLKGVRQLLPAIKQANIFQLFPVK